MKTDSKPRVIEAQRMMDGVIITFDDGRRALYSSILLHETLGRAEEILDEDWTDLPGS